MKKILILTILALLVWRFFLKKPANTAPGTAPAQPTPDTVGNTGALPTYTETYDESGLPIAQPVNLRPTIENTGFVPPEIKLPEIKLPEIKLPETHSIIPGFVKLNDLKTALPVFTPPAPTPPAPVYSPLPKALNQKLFITPI